MLLWMARMGEDGFARQRAKLECGAKPNKGRTDSFAFRP